MKHIHYRHNMWHPDTHQDRFKIIEECSSSPVAFGAQTKLRHGGGQFLATDAQRHLYMVADRADLLVVTKARQIGMTEAVVRYLLWKAVFKGETSIVYAPTRGMAQNACEKLMAAYRSLPAWVRESIAPPISMTKDHLILDNGSEIQFSSATIAGTCGMSADNLFIDEAAFCDGRDFWYSVMPIVYEAKNTIIASTLASRGDQFDKLRIGAMDPKQAHSTHLQIPFCTTPDGRTLEDMASAHTEDTFRTELLCMYPEAE